MNFHEYAEHLRGCFVRSDDDCAFGIMSDGIRLALLTERGLAHYSDPRNSSEDFRSRWTIVSL